MKALPLPWIPRRIVTALFLISGIGFGQTLPVVRVGVAIDGPWEKNNAVRQLFQSEINELTAGEFEVRFPADQDIVSDWTVAGVRLAFDKLLNDPEVDIVLAMGVIASSEAMHRGPLTKPVIAPYVIDVDAQDLPRKNGASGVKNLSYIAIPSTIFRDIQAFREIIAFNKVYMLMNAPVVQALPGIARRVPLILKDLGVEAEVIPVGKTAENALNALPGGTEAVYLAPLLELETGEFDRLIAGLNERKIPTFSLFGREEVERGVLAGLTPDIFPKLARRVALNFQRILLGEDASLIPYAFTSGEELTINMATARSIGVFPPWGVITDAVLIGEESREAGRLLTLQSTIMEGLETNLDLLARRYDVTAGAQDVGEARANLLPQLNLSASGVRIDEDRAGIFQAERTASGSATLTQVIYSDAAWTNLSVQRSLQTSLERERDALRLDIAGELATAYLHLLSAKTFERIQKENLKLSHSNLELARVRESIGSAGRAEVYRWESEIASNRGALIDANARRNLAEIQLNRLLHRPSEESFTTREASIEESGLLSEQGKLFKYMNNRWTFKTFRWFLVEEGLRNSPEIQQIEAAIAAQERLLSNTSRAFFLPDLVAQAEISRRFLREGAGSEDLAPIRLPDGSQIDLSTGDDTNWRVGVSLSFPLFNGGAKFARRKHASETLSGLHIRRSAVAERIDQRIRSAAHLTGASFARIEQARAAAEAARKNLELVVDAYSRGVLAITQLLDAQNAMLVAEQAAANAVYVFLIDLMELERSTGSLHILRSPDEQNAFFLRADAYFEKAGVKL